MPLSNFPPIRGFLDLIRHGKPNHNNDRQPYHEHQAPPQPIIPPPPQEALLIVEEERRTSLKMPVYAGLESYQLLDKMGESVIFIHLPIIFSSGTSGAFSNVYKALDTKTRTRVAGLSPNLVTSLIHH